MQRASFILFTSLLSAAAALGAQAQAPADGPEAWRAAAFARARAAALTIEDPYRRAESLARIARTHADHDDAPAAHRATQETLDAARQVREIAFRDWILHDLALAQLQIDDVHGARETAQLIATERPQGATMAALADRDLRAGDFAAAEAVAARIRDPGARSLVIQQLVSARVARGELNAARALLNGIADPYYEGLARSDLAAAEARAGRIDRAHALAARAPRTQRADVYMRIALARTAQRDLDGAHATLKLIKDDLSAALVQGRLGAAYAQAGDASAARSLLTAAIDAARAAESSPRRAFTLAQLARLQIAIGAQDEGAKTLALAATEASVLAPGEARDDALEYIASAQARAGDVGAALGAAGRLSDRAARALLVRDILTLQGVADAASATASVREFQDPLIDAAALFGALGVQSLHAGKSVSIDVIDAARRAVERIDASLQPAALAALAAVRLKTGNAEAAAEIFRAALRAAEAVERADQRALAYVSIVDALTDQLLFLGAPPRAVG